MLNRLARPVLSGSRRSWKGITFHGQFNALPPKKVYWGKQKITGEMLIAIGCIMLPFSWYRLVDADYQFSNFNMAASHFNMDNLIIVDGEYRWIPTKMRPAEHEQGVSYDAGDSEFNFTPTDGKGL